MSAITLETKVMANHDLHLKLPEFLPIGCKLRIIIEPIDEGDIDPLDWPLTDEEQAIWEEFPSFRAQHPIRIASLGDRM